MKHLPCSAAFQLPGGVQASRLDSLLSTLSLLCFILGSLTSLGINPACEHTSLWEHLRGGLRHSATEAAVPKSTDCCLGSGSWNRSLAYSHTAPPIQKEKSILRPWEKWHPVQSEATARNGEEVIQQKDS